MTALRPDEIDYLRGVTICAVPKGQRIEPDEPWKRCRCGHLQALHYEDSEWLGPNCQVGTSEGDTCECEADG